VSAVAILDGFIPSFADAADRTTQYRTIRTGKRIDLVCKSEISPHIPKSNPRAVGPMLLCKDVWADRVPMNF